jgi:hypothetical protein
MTEIHRSINHRVASRISMCCLLDGCACEQLRLPQQQQNQQHCVSTYVHTDVLVHRNIAELVLKSIAVTSYLQWNVVPVLALVLHYPKLLRERPCVRRAPGR